MPETQVLRSPASPKNASPHMSGGQNHVQLSSPKPLVQVMTGASGPQAQRGAGGTGMRRVVPPPVPDAAYDDQGEQYAEEAEAEIGDVGDDGAQYAEPAPVTRAPGPGRPRFGAGPKKRLRGPQAKYDPAAAAAKPMVMINMNNGKPQEVSGQNANQARGNVVLLNRGNRVPQRASQQQMQRGRRGPQQPLLAAPVAAAPQLSNEALLFCRHVLQKYIDGGDAASLGLEPIAISTRDSIDRALADSLGTTASEPAAAEPISPVAPSRQQIHVGSRAPVGVAAPKRFAGTGRVAPPIEAVATDIPLPNKPIVDEPQDDDPEIEIADKPEAPESK